MWFVLALALAHVPDVYVTNSSEDWCQVIEDALGGDYVMLEEGDYIGPCDIVIEVSEPPGEITIVQSLDPGNPARMRHGGSGDYILSMTGDFGLVLTMSFPDLADGITGVELRDGRDLGVRYNIFTGAGVGVRQTGIIESVGIRDNTYLNYTGVAADVGCEGDCPPAELEVSNNVVQSGTGHMRLWSQSALVVDNTATGVVGRLMELHTSGSSVVARNALQADEPMVVTGDTEMTSNIFWGTASLESGRFAGNTLIGALQPGSAEVVGNAIVGADLGPGNMVCDASCFVDLEGRNVYPAPDSPLIGAYPSPVFVDWCAREREVPGTIGALEYVGDEAGVGPIEADFKSLVDCRIPRMDETTVMESGDTGVDPSIAIDEGGCGCGSGNRPAGALWLLGLIAGMGRRADRARRSG